MVGASQDCRVSGWLCVLHHIRTCRTWPNSLELMSSAVPAHRFCRMVEVLCCHDVLRTSLFPAFEGTGSLLWPQLSM